MTDDLVLNTTKDFIKGSKDYLDLAWKVEQAAAELRASAIDIVIEGVRDYLAVGGNPRWRICVKRNKKGRAQALCLVNEDWQTGDKSARGWEGVRLIANKDTGWDCANISIAPFWILTPPNSSHCSPSTKPSSLARRRGRANTPIANFGAT